MFDEYINEVNKQMESKEDIDGWGCVRAWIDLPTKEVAEITLEEGGVYSALLHDENGDPMLPMIEAESLYELFADLIGE